MCVIHLQPHCSENKYCLVPSGGECKQMCIENVNIWAKKLSYHLQRFQIITFTKSGGFEGTYKLS